MTSRADVERLAGATRSVADLAVEQLQDFYLSLDLSTPDLIREALLEVVPEIVRECGPVAGTAAAEWFEDVRAAEVGGRFSALLGPDAESAAVVGSVRALASDAALARPDALLSLLSGAVQRHVSYSARATVARNAAHDPLRPRFGRVPRGAKTCAWCTMLASRGFVYHSKRSAGVVAEDFHDDCDCAIVTEWDRDEQHIAGYDPDRLYRLYLDGLESLGPGSHSRAAIAAAMRRAHPDAFTDGVHEH